MIDDINKLSLFQLKEQILKNININLDYYLYELYLINYLEDLENILTLLEIELDKYVENEYIYIYIKNELNEQFNTYNIIKNRLDKINDKVYKHIMKSKDIILNINNYNHTELKNILYLYLYNKYIIVL
jgi:hypothetical protein